MKKTFGKWISVLLVALQLALILGALPVSADTIDNLLAVGANNVGWTELSALDFSTDTAVSPWSKNGNVGAIENSELSLWNGSGNPGYLQLVLDPVVSNTLVLAATYKVTSTDYPIDVMLLNNDGSGVAVATLKNNGIDWRIDTNKNTISFDLSASDEYRSLAIIANTQDNSAAIWVDGQKLAEVPYATFPSYTESLKYAWVKAAGAGTTSPTLKTLSVYDIGEAGPLEVEETALTESFSASGISTAVSAYLTSWTENTKDGTISYVEKSEGGGDYALSLKTADDSYPNAPYCYIRFPNITDKSYLEFDFMMNDMPRNVEGRKWIQLLDVDGNKDQYDIRVDYSGKLYATGYSEDVTLATDLVSDVWYRLTFETDLATDTADVKLVRVDGTGTPHTYTGLAARNADTIVRMYYLGRAAKGYNTELLYDNIKFTKGEDATSYGTMLLKSIDSAITVSNPFKTNTATISGCSAASTVADLLSVLTCTTAGTEITITDSEGAEIADNDRIRGNEIVTVTHIASGKIRTYTIDTPVQPVKFYSLDVAGRQYAKCKSITLPGKAAVWAAVTNSTGNEATYYIKGSVGSSAPAAQAVTVPANSTKRVKLTGSFIVPDQTTTGTFSVQLYSDAACQNLMGESSIALATSTVTSMPNIFGDNMVLQRGTEVNIYGLAPTGTEISAQLGSGTKVKGTAANGEFLVKLPAMEANNAGQTLTVTAGDKTFTFTDVLVGDVFYGSGQSNMVQYYNGGYNDGQLAENAVARAWLEERANWNNVRYYAAYGNLYPETTIHPDVEPWWKVGKDDDAANGVKSYAQMSSVLYSVADALRGLPIAELDDNVPIAVVRCAVGGSKMSSWIDTDCIEENKDIAPNYYEYLETATEFTESGKKYHATDLYYAMVRPLIPFTFKAAIWYQGEADVELYDKNAASENPYTDMANAMISMMREKMGYDLPYFIVQLPGYGNRNWSRIRLQQWNLYNVANKVYVAVTNDSGEKYGEYTGTENGIHPQDKRVVGDRLARLMAKYLYAETDIPYEAPNYKAAEILADGSVKISFNAVNDGLHGKLVSQGEANLPGFALSTDGSNWSAATATIAADGLSISVRAEGVAAPKYVSYTGIETASSSPFTYNYPMKSAATAYDADGDGSNDTYLALAPFLEKINVHYQRTDDDFTANQFSCYMKFDATIPFGNAKAIIAFYDEKGMMLEVGKTDITVSEGKQQVIIPVEVPLTYQSYKVFVWKDFDTLKPLVEI